MTNRTFDATTAKAILEMAFPAWVFPPYAIRDDGVYQSDAHREASAQGEAFDWTPAYDMNWSGAPDPMSAPMLPIPFTAAELAAFMLDGTGAMVPEVLGVRIGYPIDESVLPNAPRLRVVREALQSAFALAAEAQTQIGEFDYAGEAYANELATQFDTVNGEANLRHGVFKEGISDDERRCRRAQAAESVLSLKVKAREAMMEMASKWSTWRGAMVMRLLGQEATTPEPVMGEYPSNAPLALTTSDIAFCFDGIRWSEKEWRKPLGDKPKWLRDCIVIPGQQGVRETRWNPVCIGAALVRYGHASQNNIRARFQTKPRLNEWLEAWKTYEADYLSDE